jgi:hypothetical protein
MSEHNTNGVDDERQEIMNELDSLKDRLIKLKCQEQLVVDEEEAIQARITKLQKQTETLGDKDVTKQMESVLSLRPSQTPLLLSLSLGKARFILPERQRLRYKKEYEQFKLTSIGMHFVISAVQLFHSSLFIDAVTNFHLVYYYSTLTLREHIMVANGSHIRFWWRLHHYLCVVIAGVLLIWPNGAARQSMRTPLIHFAIFVSAVQVLQYRYQMRRLYKLRALNRVGPMETTTESATVHVKNDLAFLLPFLLFMHGWQFWLARRFWGCAAMDGSTWHVRTLATLFFMIGGGNLTAVLYTALHK